MGVGWVVGALIIMMSMLYFESNHGRQVWRTALC